MINTEALAWAIEHVEGYMRHDEAVLLAQTAQEQCAVPGEWVEVGSFCGKSTCLLAIVLQQENHRIPLRAIDPHEGVLSYPGSFDSAGRYVAGENYHGASSLDRFNNNLAAMGVREWVTLLQQFSTDVQQVNPISLIFIDGLHDYDSVKADYEHFRPFFTPDTAIIFHDYDWSGPQLFVDELVAAGEITIVHQATSLIVSRLNTGDTE